MVGRYFYGDYCTGELWSIKNRAGRALDQRLEPVRIRLLTSFGERATGELFATSFHGRVYRLDLRASG